MKHLTTSQSIWSLRQLVSCKQHDGKGYSAVDTARNFGINPSEPLRGRPE